MQIELTLTNGSKKLESFEFDTAGECSEQVREAIYQAFVRGLAVELHYEDMPWEIRVVVRDCESQRITGEGRPVSKILKELRKHRKWRDASFWA